MPVTTIAKLAIGMAVLAALTGIVFAAWMDKGAGIFMAMIQNGLAWCL